MYLLKIVIVVCKTYYLEDIPVIRTNGKDFFIELHTFRNIIKDHTIISIFELGF